MADLRDRFFTPRVAKALMSPWRLLLGVGVAVVAAVAGLHVIAAIGLGAVVHAATVAPSLLSPGTTGPPIDPFAVSEPWRHYVQGARSARARFDAVLAATRPGPIRDRLVTLGARLDHGLDECWRIARHGDEIDAAVTRMDVVAIRARLGALRARAAPADTATDSVIASLEAQLASAERLKATSARTAERLSLVRTRLDELVARAGEVGVGTSDPDTFGHDVDELVLDLEGLRLALEDTDRAAGSAPRDVVDFGSARSTEITAPATQEASTEPAAPGEEPGPGTSNDTTS